jgi:hypothetical protein
MRKTILTVLGATLVAATTIQMAAASEHRARKAFSAPASQQFRAPASQQFRNAEDSVAWSAQPGWYSRYSGGISAPAGR